MLVLKVPLTKMLESELELHATPLKLFTSIILAERVIWPTNSLAMVFEHPEFLDEFIRRTGVRVHIPSNAVKGGVELKV